jgi:hypothetical protein
MMYDQTRAQQPAGQAPGVSRRRTSGPEPLVPAGTSAALAQAWPSKPIKVLVGVPPGGSTDALTRLFADWLEEHGK